VLEKKGMMAAMTAGTIETWGTSFIRGLDHINKRSIIACSIQYTVFYPFSSIRMFPPLGGGIIQKYGGDPNYWTFNPV